MEENKTEEIKYEDIRWYTNLKCYLGAWFFGRVGFGIIIALVDAIPKFINNLIEWGFI